MAKLVQLFLSDRRFTHKLRRPAPELHGAGQGLSLPFAGLFPKGRLEKKLPEELRILLRSSETLDVLICQPGGHDLAVNHA